MKITFYDTHSFERKAFEKANVNFGMDIEFLDIKLNTHTASLAYGSKAICSFVNDKVNQECLKILHELGVKMVALRSAGFNHVDLKAASDLGIQIARVPGYSPYAVAEFTLGLILCLNRKIHKSYARVRDLNFSLDGLVGFDLQGKTIGIVGTGKIGSIVAKTLQTMGCRILAHDKFPGSDFEYVDLKTLFAESEVISLHIPLIKETKHLINDSSILGMKDNVYIINTGRGGLIDTQALIRGLKSKKIAGVALDVYEEEEEFFFKDLSITGLSDDKLARLLTFPNVLITSHQAFLTNEALDNIATTTLENLKEFFTTGNVLKNKVN